jgi:MAC/Perforin domain
MSKEPTTLNIEKLTDKDYAILESFLKKPAPRPLDTKPYLLDLVDVDIPPPKHSVDHTKEIDGYGPGEGGGHRDVLTELTLGEVFGLLKDNHIDLEKKDGRLGALHPYIVGKTLRPAGSDAVRFSGVKLLTPEVSRIDSVGFSYTEFESNLQRQTTAVTSTGFGVPEIFKVDASYSDASAISTYDRTVQIYFQASQLVPKVHVVFNRNDITLAPELVTTIQKASSGKPEDLLAKLEDYGHFVALSKILGGRITLHTTTEIRDRSQFEARKIELVTAADARFSVDGVPAEAGGGGGVKTKKTETKTLSEQAKSLTMELRGGKEGLASSTAGTLGTQWISSIGPYREWRTIGFPERSLAPILDFLPETPTEKDKKGSPITLKEKCNELLRDYFRSKLVRRRTAVGGNLDADRFGHEIDVGVVKRITKIVVNHGVNFDGLRWWFELYDTASADAISRAQRNADPHSTGSQFGRPVVIDTGRWIGAHGGEHEDTIELQADEEITAIELGTDASGGVVKIAFKTNKNRYPGDEGFYGRARVDKYTTIEAPRVRGFFGYKGARVHGIGLLYLGLGDDAKSREYLLAMEPYLFPDSHDYGIIK